MTIETAECLGQSKVSLGEAWIQRHCSAELLNTVFHRTGKCEGATKRKPRCRVSAIKFYRLSGERGCAINPPGSLLSGSVPTELYKDIGKPGISLGEVRIKGYRALEQGL